MSKPPLPARDPSFWQMSIAPGSIFRAPRRGNVAYVVVRRDEFDPRRWRV